MEKDAKKNEVFLYIGAFFITTASLSVGVLLLMLLYLT
jgi:hypothetical protein